MKKPYLPPPSGPEPREVKNDDAVAPEVYIPVMLIILLGYVALKAYF